MMRRSKMSRQKLFVSMLTTTLVLAAPWSLWAEDPFGEPMKQPTPKNAADKAKAAKAGADGRRDPLPAPEPAVVAEIRLMNPTTAAPLVRAIDSLISFEATDLAKEYFKRLTALNLSEAQLVALGEEIDPDMLARIAAAKSLGPGAARFAQSVLDAVHKARTDSGRLAGLVAALADANSGQRAAARQDLRLSGVASVAPLVKALADESRKPIHPEARTVLVSLGSVGIDPLTAVFDTAEPALQAQIAAVLFHLANPRTLDTMLAASATPDTPENVRRLATAMVERSLGRVPSREEIAARLRQATMAYLDGDREVSGDVAGKATVWRWDPARRELTERELPVPVASALYAARLARKLLAVTPDSGEAAELSLLANLHAEKLAGGLAPAQAPDPATARHRADLLEKILARSMKKNYIPAAIAAVEALGGTGDVTLLRRGGATPTPLVRAASHADRRLRLAAVEAIVRLNPTEPFAGSSAVSRALEYFAHFSGKPRAVVADPIATRGHQLAAMLDEAGLKTTVVTTGRDLFAAAAGSPEVEALFIVFTLEHPSAEETIRQLRADPRTATLPIGLIADVERLYRAEGIAVNDPLTQAFVRPRDMATVKERIATLKKLEGAYYVPPAERQAQAARALELLVALSSRPERVFDLSRHDATVEAALWVPELSPAVIKILAQLGTPRAQKTLVDVASAAAIPIESRRVAAAAFADSLRRHGIRLTIAQIQEQSARYDRSADQDQETQNVLWSILDSLQTVKKKR